MFRGVPTYHPPNQNASWGILEASFTAGKEGAWPRRSEMGGGGVPNTRHGHQQTSHGLSRSQGGNPLSLERFTFAMIRGIEPV